MPDFSEFSQHPAALPVTIIGLVGGPGSGKGTQCERLTKALPTIEHLSIGETLRQEMQSGSPYAQIIKQNMSAGMVGPPALTVGLLRRRMETSILERGISTFILDGFPRNIEQCNYLERMIAPIRRVIVLDCSDELLTQRLAVAKRDRFDDRDKNIIGKRIQTFRETTSQVIEMFERRGTVVHIQAERSVDEVAEQMRTVLQSI